MPPCPEDKKSCQASMVGPDTDEKMILEPTLWMMQRRRGMLPLWRSKRSVDSTLPLTTTFAPT
eukprot:CAMPEP_0169465532 /NCGR_PEP_ID=MMETSP1042-20121227/21267_1 /TAXON_ID=464988 /ORGANISM="Hemiselmis andersenii, Strain CCMP1180" /LENGTH=62 /DNA_ID=CAMNT_0009578489 /DNA_START=219 /DNA_END=407 /DNA_ORIENTATION=+